MGKLRKFCSLTGRERLLLFEACLLLLLSNLSIKTIAFKHINSYLRAGWNNYSSNANGGDIERDISLVKLSLLRAANAMPWKSLCLSRSIAGLIMLRRRGIPAVLIAGVKPMEMSSLHAHAWIRTWNGVIDFSAGGDSEDDESGFAVLVRVGDESLLASLRNSGRPARRPADLRRDVK
jgi:Transglutaminase-like superfamily